MNNIFTNDKFFLTVTSIGVIGSIIFSIIEYVAECSRSFLISHYLLSALCILIIYISYRKHSKNIMKGMMGAFLMAQLLCSITAFSNIESKYDKIFSPLYFLMVLLLFINHFVINADRHPSREMVNMNQILVGMLTLINIVWSICWMVQNPAPGNIIAEFAGMLSLICMITGVVCVESRLDAYRINREEAGWNEKTGYPEGYVHEYEKK